MKESRQEFLQRVLEKSARMANDSFGKVAGTIKDGDNSQVVTETDIAIGRFLVEQIQQAYPEHNVIDEETGTIDKKSNYTWVVDPIDGTSNFAQGVPLYGVMLGLLQDNMPVAGGIALPPFSEIYVAEKGSGTLCNGRQARVSEETHLSSILLAYPMDGHPERPEKTKAEGRLLAHVALRVRSIRASNSVFDFAMAAKGKYGGVLHQSGKIWDHVAPHIVLEEAGALYTDFWGKPMDYSTGLKNPKQNYTVCTASPGLHSQLQKIIHAF